MRTPRNRFTITEHDDGHRTVIHNGVDISNLVQSVDVHFERTSTTVTATFVDCRVNGDDE